MTGVDSRIMERVAFPAGHLIFKEGQRGDRAYVLQSGRVEILRHLQGRDYVLGEVGPGGLFGEMALVDDQPRMATARVAEPSVAVIIGRRQFDEKLRTTDPFVRALLKILTNNIRDISNRVLHEAHLRDLAMQSLRLASGGEVGDSAANRMVPGQHHR